MKQMREEKEAKQRQIEEDKNRKLLLKEQAQRKVFEQFEAMKNAPTLREQQDSRLKLQDEEESPAKEKNNNGVTEYKTQAYQSFIERNIPKNQVFLNITNMATWKKKNRVDEKTKVFIVKGGYGDIKRALKQRGWV
jgi:hypothetical protein